MDKKAIKELIQSISEMDFSDPATKPIVLGLFETTFQMIIKLQEEVQSLKNEINRLKGEKGKPDIKPNRKEKRIQEKMEKHESKKWSKTSKDIKIDRTEIIEIDKSILPNDAISKGYEDKVIQNIKVQTDNVLYRLEVFYSPSKNKTYKAQLDSFLEATSFGPELKAFILTMYFELRITENLIHKFLKGFGLDISEGQISNIIIKDKAKEFTEEKEQILATGIENSKGINIDDSGFRENGINKYINIVCGLLFSVFIVNENKKGKTIENMLKGFNIRGKPLTCDDAPQWKKTLLGMLIQLCWVHEERHYQKLNPIIKKHRKELDLKISQIWEYYNDLKKYKKKPTEEFKQKMLNEFDDIFNIASDYPALDKRLKLTYAKKEELLLVLDYPDIDIHNNLSENGIRSAVIKRKISNGTRTDQGTVAWENHLSISSTCKKNNIRYYDYILEIFKCENHKTSLSDAIKQKMTDLS